jgi:hypothetical protein
MKKVILVAFVSVFSTVAFSQSVVTDPVGAKPKTPETEKVVPSHMSLYEATKYNAGTSNNTQAASTPKNVNQPVTARKPVKRTRVIKQ